MSKTNETPKLGYATPADRRMLDDTELNAVTGGESVQHSEFKIVKLLDAATPKLYEAACKGTHLPEVVIGSWRAS